MKLTIFTSKKNDNLSKNANKEPIVNFKFTRQARSPFLCYKSTLLVFTEHAPKAAAGYIIVINRGLGR